VIAEGAVHVPGWLSLDEQRELVIACRQWARPPAGMRATRMPTGGMMSVQTVCLGWHWVPYRYSRTADDVDGAPVKPFPGWLADLGRRAVAEARSATGVCTPAEAGAAIEAGAGTEPGTRIEAGAGTEPGTRIEAGAGTATGKATVTGAGTATGKATVTGTGTELGLGVGAAADYQPDVALINYYDGNARMGMHADKDERSLAPVVSLSLGATCVFRFGTPEHRGRPWTDVELESGDLFVFGGPSRLAYHGVPRTLPGTGDPTIGLTAGRLNITLRESGLT
jgi:alkylated DNA repair protein (DNA oxidative demethylase)